MAAIKFGTLSITIWHPIFTLVRDNFKEYTFRKYTVEKQALKKYTFETQVAQAAGNEIWHTFPLEVHPILTLVKNTL